MLHRTENGVGQSSGSRWKATLRFLGRNFHVAASVLLAAGLVPAFRSAHLPLRFDWAAYFRTYWVGLALQSVFVAVILYLIGMPVEETLQPVWNRYRREKLRLAIALPMVALLMGLFGIGIGLLLSVDAIAFAELVDRSRNQQGYLITKSRVALLPASYLFFAFIMVFSYNDVIASIRFDGTADVALNRIDLWLLRGVSVSSLAHQAVAHFPLRVLGWMSFVYFAMFPQIGACLLLLAFRCGTRRALLFIATIVTAYYLALLCFFFIPAAGPFFLCPTHFSVFPADLGVFASQSTFVKELAKLQTRHGLSVIGTDYFIGFPCMHLAQPVIVFWYLRRWKRIAACLAAFDLALIPSIILLEQHYVVDLIGGIVVAIVAIAMLRGTFSFQESG